jgi:hypothetical protein
MCIAGDDSIEAVFQCFGAVLLSRWEVWRKYEHFCRVYDALCTKYANHKIARLPSLDRVKKTWKNLAAGLSEPVTSPASVSGAAAAEEDATDESIFLGHAFLQKLQVSSCSLSAAARALL